MKKYIETLLVVLTIMAAADSARAQLIPIAVPNGSFESPAATSSSSPYDLTSTSSNLIDDWTAVLSDGNGNNPYGVANNSILTSPGASDASQSAYLQVYFNSTNTTLTTNSSLATIAANTTYTFTLAVGAPATPGTFDGTSGTDGESAGQADFYLLANGASVTGETVANTSVSQGTLTDYSISFTTGASGGVIGDALTIQLEADKAFYPGAAADPGNEAVIFDNLRLTETPEPSTYAMLLVGGMSLLFFARRNRALRS
jgi:hypothetical protein